MQDNGEQEEQVRGKPAMDPKGRPRNQDNEMEIITIARHPTVRD